MDVNCSVFLRKTESSFTITTEVKSTDLRKLYSKIFFRFLCRVCILQYLSRDSARAWLMRVSMPTSNNMTDLVVKHKEKRGDLTAVYPLQMS